MTIASNAHVARPEDVAVEWDAKQNKLRISEPATDTTLAVFDNSRIYGVVPAVQAGPVLIRERWELPEIIRILVKERIIQIERRFIDPIDHSEIVDATVLLD